MKELAVIEHYCSHVMNVLGYKPLYPSRAYKEIKMIRLLDDEFEALRWLSA